MKTDKLKVMLEIAETLGFSDLKIMWEDGRNGTSELVDAHASIRADTSKTSAILLIKRGS